MRLIDANALKNTLNEVFETVEVMLFDDIIATIDNAPTAEITEEQAIDKLHDTDWLPLHDKEMTKRPTGEWIIIDDTEKFIAKCSVCGRIEDSRMVKNYPFCPYCGADMRGINK